jgi:hypothetical protein
MAVEMDPPPKRELRYLIVVTPENMNTEHGKQLQAIRGLLLPTIQLFLATLRTPPARLTMPISLFSPPKPTTRQKL